MTDGRLIHVEGKASLMSIDKPQVIIGGRRPAISDDARRVVNRFQQLLDGHLLNRAQLLRLIPAEWDWSLGHLRDDEALLQSLTAARIAWLAARFGVREDWLMGCGDRIYDWPMGYKQPLRFARTLAELGWLGDDLRMTVLAAGYRRDTSGPLGLFTIVFSYPIAKWDAGEITIWRHLNFDAGRLDWSHPPCRFDALALARWFHCTHCHEWIPIVPVKLDQVNAIAEGKAFPGPLIPWGAGGFDYLEDRVLDDDAPSSGDGKSRAAVKDPEFDAVLDYFNKSGLASIQRNCPATEGEREI